MSEEMEEISFPIEDCDKMVFEAIDAILGPRVYDERQVPQWIN